ncbi:MAG TPA: FAD-binding protein, partial [Anaerolineales bacterium]|nr:FAD-binding protein [Anaerolineales bacterium]
MQANGFDVIIVGAGPAGIFAALELSQNPKVRVAILDKGDDIDRRNCPLRELGGTCRHCKPCAILDGWGGAGAFSDGKLTLSPAVGGHLAEILGNTPATDLIQHVDDIYRQFGAPEKIHGIYTDEIEDLEKRAALARLHFVSVPIRHIGTERCVDIMRAMRDALLARGVTIRTRADVAKILTENGQV